MGGLPVSRCVSVLTNRPIPDSKAVEDRSVSVIPLIDLSSSIFCCEIRFKLPDFSLSSMSLYFSSIFSFSFVRDSSFSICFLFCSEVLDFVRKVLDFVLFFLFLLGKK